MGEPLPTSQDRPDSRSGKKSASLAPGGAGGDAADDAPALVVDLIRGKNLIKSDLIGKSDPYAVLKFGKQKDKTNVAKNTQNPEWNHRSKFGMGPDDDNNDVSIEVFDKDKFGKDKSIGSIEIDPRDLQSGGDEPRWFPLKGVKSGEILLNSEFLAPGQTPSKPITDGQYDSVIGSPDDRPGR